MREHTDLLIWGDNWWIEDDKAWFVWGLTDILCYLDLRTHEYVLLECIPDKSPIKFRLTPYCMKFRDDIYCMPVYGKSIWIYNTDNAEFNKIGIPVPDGELLNICDFWQYENKLYMVSNGLGQIIEIDPAVKRVENYYDLHDRGYLSKSVKTDTAIYCLSGDLGIVYQFNLIKKEVSQYKLPDIGRKFNTFCFDGEKFWLSGFQKEIYVWDRDVNKVITVDGFPEGFGIYDFSKETDEVENCIADKYEKFTFLHAEAVGENVWFIPYCTNKIIYVNKHTYQLHAFEIDEETETRESILERSSLVYKYLFDYVKDDRYLGLFSIKNKCILEIDTAELKYEYKRYDYHISDKYIKEYAASHNNLFSENDMWSRKVYSSMIQMRNHDTFYMESESTGANIYEVLLSTIE